MVGVFHARPSDTDSKLFYPRKPTVLWFTKLFLGETAISIEICGRTFVVRRSCGKSKTPSLTLPQIFLGVLNYINKEI